MPCRAERWGLDPWQRDPVFYVVNHGTKKLVDEASFSPDFGMGSRPLWDIGR